jgi:glycosyltransferase involved in cell wall biosynthesis
MATGLPVVATDVGDARRILGDAGVIVPPRDPGALAAAIRGLAADPARRRALGARGRARIETHFTLARAAEAFEALYGAT